MIWTTFEGYPGIVLELPSQAIECHETLQPATGLTLKKGLKVRRQISNQACLPALLNSGLKKQILRYRR